MKGSIFDIRRFSTHDGDGIRTTVFLKGCPLRCAWCQNPEGISHKRQPVHFEGKCIHCRTCVHLSEQGGVYEKDGEIYLRKDREENWEKLLDACPSGALAMDSRIVEIDDLVAELRKDEVFFQRGGGVTLSGGEPLGQPEFALSLLKCLHEKGIHTAVESALHVPEETVWEVLPYVDLLYADMKLAREEEHKKYTGVTNRRIKQNLRNILSSEHKEKVIVRTPLIPEYTATKENLTEIAAFLKEIYPEVKYELLNYNPLAEAKYHLVDRDYCFKENPGLYSREQMTYFGEVVKTAGIKNVIIEV